MTTNPTKRMRGEHHERSRHEDENEDYDSRSSNRLLSTVDSRRSSSLAGHFSPLGQMLHQFYINSSRRNDSGDDQPDGKSQNDERYSSSGPLHEDVAAINRFMRAKPRLIDNRPKRKKLRAYVLGIFGDRNQPMALRKLLSCADSVHPSHELRQYIRWSVDPTVHSRFLEIVDGGSKLRIRNDEAFFLECLCCHIRGRLSRDMNGNNMPVPRKEIYDILPMQSFKDFVLRCAHVPMSDPLALLRDLPRGQFDLVGRRNASAAAVETLRMVDRRVQDARRGKDPGELAIPLPKFDPTATTIASSGGQPSGAIHGVMAAPPMFQGTHHAAADLEDFYEDTAAPRDDDDQQEMVARRSNQRSSDRQDEHTTNTLHGEGSRMAAAAIAMSHEYDDGSDIEEAVVEVVARSESDDDVAVDQMVGVANGEGGDSSGDADGLGGESGGASVNYDVL